jgi:uncharacterized protein YoxC
MSLETGIAFISLAFLLMVIFIIPSILQIRRVAKSLSETLETLNRSLPEILKNLEEITLNIRQASNTVQVQVEGLALVSGRIQSIMGFILDLEELLRGKMKLPVFQALTNFMAFKRGLMTFLSVYRSGK